MYFEETGDKKNKTVIFIHGAMWPRSFARQEILSNKFRTVFVQMDGHGKEFDSLFERDKEVEELADYITKNKIEKPHIVGFSLGSQIAMILADKHYELLGKIALISPLTDASDKDIERIKSTMKTAALLVKFEPFARIAASVLKIEDDMKKEFEQEMKKQKVTELADNIMKERLNLKDLKHIKKIKNEFYIAVGAKDAECFQNTARNLKNTLKNSVVTVFEKCGHNLPMVGYKKLNSDLKLFFKN